MQTDNSPYRLTPRPLVLLIGFLGAGKTTFLRELTALLPAKGIWPSVIINDYQNAGIDAESLRSATEEVQALNGSCVCCDSSFELIDALLTSPNRENSVMLVEANGTTDPFRLIELLTVQPQLRARYQPVLMLGIVDLQRWQKRAHNNALEHLQIEPASHLYFTREKQVLEERSRRVREDIGWINPRAEETTPEAFAQELYEVIYGESRGGGSGLDADWLDSFDHSALEEGRTFRRPPSRRKNHFAAHGFCSFQIDLPKVVSGVALLEWLASLPSSVLRVKGVVQIEEYPGLYYVFHRTDDASQKATLVPLPVDPTVPPQAIFIGVRLPEETIRATACEMLGIAKSQPKTPECAEQ